ncbi:MAG: apolipoprotein N-acyltransferase, partial [Candidatus Latescibacterota bacterium]
MRSLGTNPLLPPIAAGILSGTLYGLSLPTADLDWLAWICLVPVLAVAFKPSSTEGAFLSGLAAGGVAGGFRVYWIAETLGRYGNLDVAESVATTCLLVIYLALYPMLFVGVCHSLRSGISRDGHRQFRGAGLGFPWLAAATWSLLDWAQTWMISGFPWAVLGTSQYDRPLIASFAALAGVHGLTFAIVAVNGGLTQLLFAKGRRRRLAGGVAVLLPLLLIFVWSDLHLSRLSTEPTGPPLRVGIVQGNIGQDVKWKPGWKQATMQKYIELTRNLAKVSERLDLILWPETALPFRFDDATHAAFRRSVTQLATDLDTPLLIGSLGTKSSTGQPGLFNRSFLIARDGRLAATADKVHLVPFGEYLPFPWFFGYMSELTAQSGAFDPGKEHAVLPLPPIGPQAAGQRLGLFICYESIFPSIPRELTRKGASILVNTTNDAWFGTTAAPYQHFAMVSLRAVETGRPVLRAANTGISGAIDADGRVLHATDLFTTDTVVVEVRPRTELTPYVRFGDVIFVLSAGIWGGFLLLVIRRRRSEVLRDMDAAARQLGKLAAQPVPLQRPVLLLPGYDSSTTALRVLQDHLQRSFTETSGRIIEVDLRQDLPLTGLVALAQNSQPRERCDYIGHSLGGLVATALARETDDEPWIIALATPFGGTRLATLARWLRFPLRAILTDLGRKAKGLAGLGRLARQLKGFRAFHLLGDPVCPGLPDSPGGAFLVPLLLGPLRRH